MSFAQHRARLTEGVFATLGVDARWTGVDVPVRVRLREADDTADYSGFGLIHRVRVIRVRESEVPTPNTGDIVELLAEDGTLTGDRFRVSGEAELDRNRVWPLPVTRIEP